MTKQNRRQPRQFTLSDEEVAEIDAVRAARAVLGLDSKMLSRSAAVRAAVRAHFAELDKRMGNEAVRAGFEAVSAAYPSFKDAPEDTMATLGTDAKNAKIQHLRALFEAHRKRAGLHDSE